MILYLAIIPLSLILIKATDQIIISLRRLAKITRFGSFAFASIIFALASSFPELFIGITSALNSSGALSLGNLFGANIINLSLIIGLAGLFAGIIKVKKEDYLSREFLLALIAGCAPFLLLWDRVLSRVDGLILLALYGAFATGLFQKRFSEVGEAHRQGVSWHLFFKEVEVDQGHIRRELVRFFASVGALLLSADLLVRLATNLASDFGIPIFIVGLLIISLGTTLPELSFAFRAVRSGEPMLLIGNALGTIVVNANLIVGLVALISPVYVPQRREYLLAAITFVVSVLLFWFFTRTKHYLERWESGILLFVYLAFVFLTVSGINLYSLLQ